MQSIDFIAIAGAATASITPVVLKRFQAKWIPLRVKKARQNEKIEPRSDSIGTEKALAAETFGPARSGWLADFQVTMRRLSRRRRKSRHRGISIYRLNVIGERRRSDLDLIHDQARIDDRHRFCELAHSTHSTTKLLRGQFRHELPR
jgi:hypothetical protein